MHDEVEGDGGREPVRMGRSVSDVGIGTRIIQLYYSKDAKG